MDRELAERLLRWLLRVSGAILFTAIFAVPLSHQSMSQAKQWLGMGPMPPDALTSYLARSLSLLYAFHGVIELGLSMNVARYLPMIRLVGASTLLFGAALVPIDLAVGLPLWWTLIEGPSIMCSGAAMLVLAHLARPRAEG